MTTSIARGVVFIHSAPRALCPHVEWAAGRALGHPVNFDWRAQPVLGGAQRTEYYWEGPREWVRLSPLPFAAGSTSATR